MQVRDEQCGMMLTGNVHPYCPQYNGSIQDGLRQGVGISTWPKSGNKSEKVRNFIGMAYSFTFA